MPAINNHIPESAYATKVDDKGRTNIVAPEYIAQAQVTAMQTAADNDHTAIFGTPTMVTSGATIKKGK